MVDGDHAHTFTGRVWIVAFVALAAIGGVALLVLLLREILVISAGVLLGLFATQVCHRLAKATSLPYGVWIALFIVMFGVLLGTFAYLMGAQLVDGISRLYEELGKASGQLMSHLQSFQWWSRAAGMSGSSPGSETPPLVAGAFSTAGTALYNVLLALSAFVLILIIGLFSSVQPSLYRRGFLALFPARRRPRANELVETTANALFRWVLGRLFAMSVIGIGSAVGLWLIGIPSWGTLALLTGLLNLIPDIGPVMSVVPPMVLGYERGWTPVLYVFLLYFGLHIMESYVLKPLVTQHQVSLPPVLTLSCQMVFGALGGFLGLLMAVPITVVVYTLVIELYVKDRLGEHGPAQAG